MYRNEFYEIVVIILIVIAQLYVAYWAYTQICSIKNFLLNKRSLSLNKFYIREDLIDNITANEILENLDYMKSPEEQELNIKFSDEEIFYKRGVQIDSEKDFFYFNQHYTMEIDAIYELRQKDSSKAEFSVHIIDNELKKDIIANLDRLNSTCEIAPSSNLNGKEIKVLSPGTTFLNKDNKWSIISKCLIQIV